MRIIHNLYHFKKKGYAFHHTISTIDDIPESYHYRYQGLELWKSLRRKGLSSHDALDTVTNIYGLRHDSWYRIRKRYDNYGITGVVPCSTRPHHIRERNWDTQILKDIIAIREEPDTCTWGAKKIHYQLTKEHNGSIPSISTIERMIRSLKAIGKITVPHTKKKQKTYTARPHAQRYKPQKHRALARIQIDVDHYLYEGTWLYQYTAIDIDTRYIYSRMYSRATAQNACDFLQRALQYIPADTTTIQVDGGSEFKGVFEAWCNTHAMTQLVNRPHTPKQNACVERVHRIIDEEFHQTRYLPHTCSGINEELEKWLLVYNHKRYHSGIGMTPAEKVAFVYSDNTARTIRAP